MKVLRREMIAVEGGKIPITLRSDGTRYVVDIDGVEWIKTENQMHAIVILQLLQEHVTEYVQYEIGG